MSAALWAMVHMAPTNPNALQVLAFDVGGTKIAGGLVSYASVSSAEGITCLESEAPEVIDYRMIPTDAERGGTAVLESLTEFVRDFASSLPHPPVGVGVASAGVIDPSSGRVVSANNLMPGWSGQPIKAHLEQELDLPVAVTNDVLAHALGEVRWGVARGSSSCLCVGVGTGVGGAFALNGRVVHGFHGAAGHVGHTMHPAAAGIPCACGHEGHVEAIASGTGLSARYQGRPFGEQLDTARMGDYISARADEGQDEAIEAIEYAGYSLGESIGSWCNMLDPEVVVLSGTVIQAGELWIEAVKRGFASQALDVLQGTPLVLASLGGNAPLIGAAEYLVDQLEDAGSLVRA